MDSAVSLALHWLLTMVAGIAMVGCGSYRHRAAPRLASALWVAAAIAVVAAAAAVWLLLPARGLVALPLPNALGSWLAETLGGLVNGLTPRRPYADMARVWRGPAYLIGILCFVYFLVYLLGARQLLRLRWVALRGVIAGTVACTIAGLTVALTTMVCGAPWGGMACTLAHATYVGTYAPWIILLWRASAWAQLAIALGATPLLAWRSRHWASVTREDVGLARMPLRPYVIVGLLCVLGFGADTTLISATRLVPGRPEAVSVYQYGPGAGPWLTDPARVSLIAAQLNRLPPPPSDAPALNRIEGCPLLLQETLVRFRYAERASVTVTLVQDSPCGPPDSWTAYRSGRDGRVTHSRVATLSPNADLIQALHALVPGAQRAPPQPAAA